MADKMVGGKGVVQVMKEMEVSVQTEMKMSNSIDRVSNKVYFKKIKILQHLRTEKCSE